MAATGLLLTVEPSTSAARRVDGAASIWWVSGTRVLFDLSAVAVVGCLLAAAMLRPPVGGRRDAPALGLRRAATGWAVAWCLATVAHFLAVTSELTGVDVADLVASPRLLTFAVGTPQGRALLLVGLVAFAVALWAGAVRRPGGALVLAGGSMSSLAPLLLTGHAATASNHYLAATTLLVHVLAVTVWFGVLAALVLHLRRDDAALRQVVPRFSPVALGCFVAVLVSGLVGAWVRVGPDASVWATGYGLLVLLKALALVALGGLGWWHRRRSVSALLDGRSGAFARVALGEVLVMAAAVGFAVVLSRTAPPARSFLRSAPPHAREFATVDPSLPPLTAGSLLTELRADVLVSVVLAGSGIALAVALVRSRSQRRRGQWRQAVPLASALLLTTWCLEGGLGVYATATLSAQVSQLLTLAVAVPVLLGLGLRGGPWPGQAETWRALATRVGWPLNPALAMALLVALVYQTPLLAGLLSSPTGFVALSGCALTAGVLLWVPALVCGESKEVWRGRQLAASLLLVAAVLAGYAWHMVTSSSVYGGRWFSDLGWRWADTVADQDRAAAVMAAFAVVVAGAALAAASAAVAEDPTPPA